MQKKKSPQANLENKRSSFLQIGFVAAISFSLAAFTWTSYEVGNSLFDPDTMSDILVLDEDVIPIHIPERPKVEKKPPVIIDKILIVEHDPFPEDDGKKEEIEEPVLDLDFDLHGLDDTPDILIEGPTGPMNFMAVEQKPYYKECENVLDPVAEMQCTHLSVTRWINSHARYPFGAKQRGEQGIVKVSFVINKKGEVEDVKVEQSVSPDLDAEAVRVVQSLPQFVPGSQQGRAVKVSYVIPVKFKIF